MRGCGRWAPCGRHNCAGAAQWLPAASEQGSALYEVKCPEGSKGELKMTRSAGRFRTSAMWPKILGNGSESA